MLNVRDAGRWPSQADYIAALQDPASAFTDPSLRNATVESDEILSLPKPRSGQMASVYKVYDGRRTWAVRCFNGASDVRTDRYRAIATFLARNRNRYTVGFEYAEDGIVVESTPFPIVKMEWVEGDLLHTYLANHRDETASLSRLARAWVAMARDLHELRLAHGDLQHGNVLVTPGGELKLIDYDGMFVPEFANLWSVEDGHPNYQHPCRQASDFGPQLDNFSAWVVYLSLTALARDATLWDRLHFGDDRLALGQADYERPSESPAFATLLGAADPETRKIARYLASMLSHEPQKLPPLESRAQSAPFAYGPLEAGIYREPYRPRAPRPCTPPAERFSPKLHRTLVLGGSGFAATSAGAWAFHALGFTSVQVVVVIVLGWALTAILAMTSQPPKPPGGSKI